MEIWPLLLLFVVGFIAGVINVMAGGGSTLTLPTLIFLGLDGAVANGTNRIAIFIQNMAAITSFKQQKLSRFKQSLLLAVWTLPGAIIGAMFATKISNDWFERILAIVLVGIVCSFFIKKPKRDENSGEEASSIWVYPALFGIGFYGGFIQAGVGFIIMAALFHLLKIDLINVNMHKVFIIFLYTMPALAVFIMSGNVVWTYGLILAAGNASGGWWAARLAVKKGEKLIKIILSITVMVMAIKLLGVF